VVKKVKNITIHQALRKLDLTEYEAKCYSCLVERGMLKSGDLSKLAEIPHSKIYEVINKLEKKQLVEIQSTRPMLFRALNPAIALEKLEQLLRANLEKKFVEKKEALETAFHQTITEIEDARRSAITMLKNSFEQHITPEPIEDVIWTINGQENLIIQAQNLLLRSEHNVRIMFPQDDFTRIENQLNSLAARGVKIALNVHTLTPSAQRLLKIAEIYGETSTPAINWGMMLVDDKHVLFISENFKMGFKTASSSVFMVLSNFYEHEQEESRRISV
jgi:sugar-specific transcriptional regulator TrmB